MRCVMTEPKVRSSLSTRGQGRGAVGHTPPGKPGAHSPRLVTVTFPNVTHDCVFFAHLLPSRCPWFPPALPLREILGENFGLSASSPEDRTLSQRDRMPRPRDAGT